MSITENHTRILKSIATRLGFSYCGIAPAMRLDDDARRLEDWLRKGMHGKMAYMENHFDLRVDPTKLVPGARSVITLLMNYYPAETQPAGLPKVARYAYGKDYHDVIRGKLRELLQAFGTEAAPIQGRGFVDSAPVLERSWAQRSGLGWIGKNGNLINRSAGSYFFIATLIVDHVFKYDDPVAKDYCGSCTRCIDHCPTGAILPGKVVDGSRCISYFTIELKDALIPDAMKGRFEQWLFGCDVCQEVCPWNRFATPTQEQAFAPIPELFQFKDNDWKELQEESFKKIFKDSPIKRSKWEGIQRNLTFIAPGIDTE